MGGYVVFRVVCFRRICEYLASLLNGSGLSVSGFPYDGLPCRGDTLGLNGDDGLLAVVEEPDAGLSLFVELHVGHPEQGAAVVLGVGQRAAAVVGTVEIRAHGIALHDVAAVAVGGTHGVVG